MTRRQNNNQWIVSPRHKKIPSTKFAGKVLASIFFYQYGILLIDYLT